MSLGERESASREAVDGPEGLAGEREGEAERHEQRDREEEKEAPVEAPQVRGDARRAAHEFEQDAGDGHGQDAPVAHGAKARGAGRDSGRRRSEGVEDRARGRDEDGDQVLWQAWRGFAGLGEAWPVLVVLDEGREDAGGLLEATVEVAAQAGVEQQVEACTAGYEHDGNEAGEYQAEAQAERHPTRR